MQELNDEDNRRVLCVFAGVTFDICPYFTSPRACVAAAVKKCQTYIAFCDLNSFFSRGMLQLQVYAQTARLLVDAGDFVAGGRK